MRLTRNRDHPLGFLRGVIEDACSFAADAAAGFRRNGLMTVAAVTTVMVALLVVGAGVLLGLNLARLAAAVEAQVEVVAFLQEGLGPDGGTRLRATLASLPNVASARFVPRDEALARLQNHLGDGAAFDDLVKTNPLPDSVELQLTDPAMAPSVAQEVSRQSGVSEVTYGGQVVDRVVALSRSIRLIAGLLTAFLAGVALIVVVNTIRLTVIARRQEIEIMQLVGATRWFIRWPFLIEGLLQGAAAAGASIAVLMITYAVGAARLEASLPFLPLVGLREAVEPLVTAVLIGGAGVGVLGSMIAIRRFLVA
jgi:cell division transport system permease protein